MPADAEVEVTLPVTGTPFSERLVEQARTTLRQSLVRQGHAFGSVEAEWTGKQGTIRQRFVYFPALGLGLETQRDGKANGLVAMTSA